MSGFYVFVAGVGSTTFTTTDEKAEKIMADGFFER